MNQYPYTQEDHTPELDAMAVDMAEAVALDGVCWDCGCTSGFCSDPTTGMRDKSCPHIDAEGELLC